MPASRPPLAERSAHNDNRALSPFMHSPARAFGFLFTTCCAAAVPGLLAVASQVGADAPPLTADAAKALKNPIANTAKSIARGRAAYGSLGGNGCHGNDGNARIEGVANATDLTNPDGWEDG